MDHGKVHLESVGESSDSLGTARVLGDNDCSVLIVVDVLLDPSGKRGCSVEVVDGLCEKTLHLGRMQVHGNDVVGTGHGEQVGEHSGGNGTAVLLHLGLLGVWESRNNRRGLVCASALAARNKNHELHNVVVDGIATTLHNVNVFVSDRDANLDRGFTVCKLAQGARALLNIEALADELAQLGVRGSYKDVRLAHGSGRVVDGRVELEGVDEQRL